MERRRLPYIDSMAAALVDGTGCIVGWTNAAERLLDLSAAEVTGRPVRELLADPGHRPRRTRNGWTGDTEVRTGRGEPMAVCYRVLPLAGEPGSPRHLVLCAPTDRVVRWSQDHAFTRELFLQDRIGLAVFDEQLRLVRTNTHLLPYSGLPADLGGHRLADFLYPKDAEAVDELLRDVLRTGRPVVRAEVLVRTLDDPRGGAVMAIEAFRLQTPDGRVIGVTALFGDVTEVHRSRERLELLHRATAAVGSTLSVEGTAHDLAAVLVPALADHAEVDIAEAVFTGDEPVVGADGRLTLRRTASAPPADPADGGGPVPPAGPAGPPGRAGARGPAVLVDADATAVAVDDPPAMTAPLRARGILLGVVTLRRAPARGPYEPADLDVLRQIAARTALALDNARRFTREHRAAVGLQRSLLPPAESETAAAVTASVYLPTDTASGIGGDWFDVIPLSSARVALVAGDVVGHGLQASATMGRLRTAVRTLADLDLEPDELLVHLDDLVSQLVVEDEDEDGEHPDDEDARARREADPVGATCVYAVYDPVSGRCTAASAGHPPPAVVGPDGRAAYLRINPGPPLGVGGLPFEATEVEVAPGSVLVLYTDGLIEGGAADLDEGMAGLLTRLERTDFGVGLRRAGREIVAGLPAERLDDDVTLLLAHLREVPVGATASWTIPADPAAVAGVREAATRQLEEWGLAELVFTTELVLSELVTNAIRYAGGPVEVRLIRAAALTCEVSDPSATQPRMRRARLTDEGGRGLYLVAQLTQRWGSRYTRNGKTIWAEQALTGGL
ncbi:SpoIIE family protein phosphatase [Kitasatospora cinereorecta]|uniref:SpoIIE family protein phosphatase n=1 Tax=Kitasatospora cinereorecta TaxID=285560 RepID=UPI0031F7BAC7